MKREIEDWVKAARATVDMQPNNITKLLIAENNAGDNDIVVTVIDEIAAERRRQVEKECWSQAHDDHVHCHGELASAAACYAVGRNIQEAARGSRPPNIVIHHLWPWEPGWWKPKDRRRNLVRAGALIVAEIERLDRLTASERTDT